MMKQATTHNTNTPRRVQSAVVRAALRSRKRIGLRPHFIIGLKGGRNLYTYVKGNPVSKKDPKGLVTVCKSGMHTTLGKMVGPLYHEFSCFKTADGSTVCKGFGRAEDSNPISAMAKIVPGEIKDGAENFATAHELFQDNTCEPDDNDMCMDQCVGDYYAGMANDIPRYSWFRKEGTQCQATNESIVNSCKQQCHVK